ncbi:MAG: DUF3857 and transglutaminase domain-containing protein [Chitinophagaceae bacterium]|nr:DUF3857 and transglutaminase domain-containing protein [Chitinophagaceae bacterium]
MARQLILFVFLQHLFFAVWAYEDEYAVSRVPAALIKNADVIKRSEDLRFEIIDGNRSRLYHRYALTILNENGDRYARAVAFYDKFREVKSMEGTLYAADGKKIKGLKKSEISDFSANSSVSSVSDGRVKLHEFHHKTYPYTVEYETVVQYSSTFYFPAWDPVDNEKISVVRSTFIVTAPQGYPVRYKSFNYKKDPQIENGKAGTIYKWEVSDVEAIQLEYAYPAWSRIAPMVYVGPTRFEIDKYAGDMSTWEEFGKFIYTLNQGRDKLPDDIKQKVHQLTDGLTDPKEKIATLYKYMQDNTRYISIQLGIGGYQPFDAGYVASKKYGDCKALSNYMYALLKEAGIRSCYTLVKAGAGRNYFIEDFVSSQFNHAFLCVPLQKDTVWLECTSQIDPAGYLGEFTDNRPVLLIEETGGKLVRTPRYTKKQNIQSRTAVGRIEDNGQLNVTIKTIYAAQQQDDVFRMINALSKEKQLEHLKKSIDLPHYDVVKFEYTENKAAIPTIKEDLELTAQNFAGITGKRLFIVPNITSRFYTKLKPDENRRYPVSLISEYTETDTTVINLPGGYQPESVPLPVKLETKFGRYSCSVTVDGDKITYYRRLEKDSGEYPASDYAELVKFYEQIYKADRNRVVLVKKE